MKKSFAKTKRIFKVVDKINEEVVCILQATNEKDLLRSLVFSGLFKVNRLEDLKFMEVEIPKEIKEIDPMPVLKELSIEVEDKAEKLKAETESEMRKEIAEEVKGE